MLRLIVLRKLSIVLTKCYRNVFYFLLRLIIRCRYWHVFSSVSGFLYLIFSKYEWVGYITTRGWDIKKCYTSKYISLCRLLRDCAITYFVTVHTASNENSDAVTFPDVTPETWCLCILGMFSEWKRIETSYIKKWKRFANISDDEATKAWLRG